MEIDHLDFDVTASCSAQIWEEDIKTNKQLNYDTDCLTDGAEFNNFRCPECGENLFINCEGTEEENAIKFFKGEKCLNKI